MSLNSSKYFENYTMSRIWLFVKKNKQLKSFDEKLYFCAGRTLTSVAQPEKIKEIKANPKAVWGDMVWLPASPGSFHTYLYRL